MDLTISDFDRGMIVGARQGGLSISETQLLGFSWPTVSRVGRESREKQKTAVLLAKAHC